MEIVEDKSEATKRVAGGGRKFKIEADNKGTLFAKLSLNMVQLTSTKI